ncbi:MAG: DNA-binding response regulator [Verrucomicrobia bacterium]|nr:DNA-binding response regulator [Verrucomicrobiota bacterium]
MNSRPFSAYLVEDEPLCRADFRQTLQKFPQVKLVGEADNLAAAEEFLRKSGVDLIFLDLSVGRENGFDLLEKIPQRPMVIALTAHPQHAVRGFSLDLVDYILKPVESDRLQIALAKAAHRRTLTDLQPAQNQLQVELNGEKRLLAVTEILRAESLGNYVTLYLSQGKALKRTTFKDLKKKLPLSLFLEIGRGRLLALNQVKGWSRNSKGHLVIRLVDGGLVNVSRSHSADILRKIKDIQSISP